MAIGMIDDSTLYDIGDAIREKNGSTIEYLPSEMPKAIRSIEAGVELPELGDTAAVPTDIVSGKTLYDDDGNPVTGTMTSFDSEYSPKPNNDGFGNVMMGLMFTENAYLPAWNQLSFKIPFSEFGNATEDDVLADIEFTSSAGLLARGNIPKKTANDITVNGATATIPRGYYESAVSKSVSTATQATPSISVDTAGKITASATQTAGYVSSGTKTATRQLTTQAAQTITPGTYNKTIASGIYITGTQTIQGDANLVAANIKKGVSIFGVAGSHECEDGIELPDLGDTAAQPSDIVLGKSLYDSDGNLVTGNVRELSNNYWADDEDGVTGELYGGNQVRANFTMTNDSIVRQGNTMQFRFPLSHLGISDSGSSGMYCWRKHNVSSTYQSTSENLGTTAPSDLGSTYYSYTITDDGYYQLTSGSVTLNTYHLPTGATNGKTKYIYYKQWGYSNSTYYKWTLGDTKVQSQGDFLVYVTSDDSGAHVSNGVDTDGYWYVSLDT